MDPTSENGFRRIAVIMAGGSGERFWPLSRAARPKQLLRLTSPDETLLDQALQRASGLASKENVFVATTRLLFDAIAETDLCDRDRILAEPVKRNTLGCLVWVTANLIARHPKDWEKTSLAVITADHRIEPIEHFQKTALCALDEAEQTGGLVTIGIRPTRAETGFGYIEIERELDDLGGIEKVVAFREKPYQDLADEYLASGRHLWNSGMFFWTLSAFAEEMRAASPAAYATMMAIASNLATDDVAQAEKQFAALPSISIDYALLERSHKVYVAPADFEWDDVGTYDALCRTMPTDRSGNVLHGKALALRSSGSVVYNADSDAVVCVLGVHGLVVVVADDAILVCPQHEAQHVREVVAKLQENHPEHL